MPTSGPCTSDIPNPLMDGDPDTCSTINNQVLRFSKNATKKSARVTVHTMNMSCEKQFFVSVSALCPHQCPNYEVCELTYLTEEIATETTHCDYDCKCRYDGYPVQWIIRFAHIGEGQVCDFGTAEQDVPLV